MNCRLLPLAASLALSMAGCSVHWHAGTGTSNSTGTSSGGAREPAPAHHHASEPPPSGRHSPAGRGIVVRVTPGSKPAVDEGTTQTAAEPPARSAVHPTGAAPAGSAAAGSAGGSDSSGTAAGASGSAGGGSSSGSSAPEGSAPASTAGSAPARTGKDSRKTESEPHVTKPVSRRSSRKAERVDTKQDPASTTKGEGTVKDGPRE